MWVAENAGATSARAGSQASSFHLLREPGLAPQLLACAADALGPIALAPEPASPLSLQLLNSTSRACLQHGLPASPWKSMRSLQSGSRGCRSDLNTQTGCHFLPSLPPLVPPFFLSPFAPISWSQALNLGEPPPNPPGVPYAERACRGCSELYTSTASVMRRPQRSVSCDMALTSPC